MVKFTSKIKEKMKKVAAMHAVLGALCLSITIFFFMAGISKCIIAFSVLTAVNIAGIVTIGFFYKRGYV